MHVPKLRLRWKQVLTLIVSLAVVGFCGAHVLRQLRASHHYAEAEVALSEHRLDEAHAHLISCLGVWAEKPEVHLLLARAARCAEDFTQAEEQLRICERLGGIPHAVELERVLTRVQRGMITPEVEEKLWALAKSDHADATFALAALSRGYLGMLRLGRASKSIDELLRRRPEHIDGLYLRGKALELRGDSRGALADFQHVLDLEPLHDRARRGAATLLAEQKRFQEALPHFRSLRERFPSDPGVIAGLVRCLQAVNETVEAEAVLSNLKPECADNVELLVERAKLGMANAKLAEAEGHLRRALQINPTDRDTLFNLAACVGRLGKRAEQSDFERRLRAVEQDTKALADAIKRSMKAPADPTLRCEIGKILMRLGRQKEALAWVHSALRESPDNTNARELMEQFQGTVRNSTSMHKP